MYIYMYVPVYSVCVCEGGGGGGGINHKPYSVDTLFFHFPEILDF